MPPFVATAPPVPAPAAPVVGGDGAVHRLAEFRGRVVLINFWAVWCPACLVELPSLDRLQAHLGGPGFAVVALAQQSGAPEVVRAFLRRRGLRHLTVYVDEGRRLGRAFGQSLFPTTILIDRNGCASGRLVGPVDWDSPAARALIQSYLDRGKGAAPGAGVACARPAGAPAQG